MNGTAAVIGAGLIGRAWAMVFARAGWRVRLHDSDAAQLAAARRRIAENFAEQQAAGLVDDVAATIGRIDGCPELDDALAGCDWVQENLPEQVDIKRSMFARLDRQVRDPYVSGSEGRR